MLTYDTTVLLQYIECGLRGHYAARSFSIKSELFKRVPGGGLNRYNLLKLHSSNNLYLLNWLYANKPRKDKQEIFNAYIKAGAIDCVRRLYQLDPTLNTKNSIQYAAESNNLYCVKWIYHNITNNISKIYPEQTRIDTSILEWLSYMSTEFIIDIETVIWQDDLKTFIWYIETYGESNMNYEELGTIIIHNNKVRLLRWLINNCAVDYNEVIRVVIDDGIEYASDKHNLALLWLISIYPDNYLIAQINKASEY